MSPQLISCSTSISTETLIDVFKNSTNKLKDVEFIICQIMYRLKKAVQGTTKQFTRKQALEAAQITILLSDMPSTQQALDAGKLESLMINTQDDGLLTTTGRFGEDTTKKIFGVNYLPVLMKETRTAELYMMQAHRGDDDLAHRLAQDMLARTKILFLTPHLRMR